MRNKKIQLFILLFIAVVLMSVSLPYTILAATQGLETTYPAIGGGGYTITSNSTFPQYIKYIYKLTIWIAGILVVLLLIGGAISYLTSAGNPAKMNDAKSRILAALVGLGVILISWLISNMINPQLHVLKIENIKDMGIWIEDTNGKRMVVGDDISNLPDNFIPLKICFASSTNGEKPLYEQEIKGVDAFLLPNFEGPATKFSLPQNGCSPLGGVKSIKILWNTPGVYIDIANNVGVPLPFRITHSYHDIHSLVHDFYDNPWKSIEIKNSTSTDFGAVFFSQRSYAGKGYIYPGKGENGPNIIPIESGDDVPKFDSIYLFQRDENNSVKVYLYQTLHYQEKDENGNIAECPSFCPVGHTIDSPAPLGDCSQKVQSIKVYRGLAILIQDAGSTSPYSFTKAEVFTANDPDLTDNHIGQCGSKSLLHWFRYVANPCATHFMLLPIKE